MSRHFTREFSPGPCVPLSFETQGGVMGGARAGVYHWEGLSGSGEARRPAGRTGSAIRRLGFGRALETRSVFDAVRCFNSLPRELRVPSRDMKLHSRDSRKEIKFQYCNFCSFGQVSWNTLSSGQAARCVGRRSVTRRRLFHPELERPMDRLYTNSSIEGLLETKNADVSSEFRERAEPFPVIVPYSRFDAARVRCETFAV